MNESGRDEMQPPRATLMVSVDNPVVCIRITGRADFTSSVDFKALINRLCEEGRRFFALDLTDCLIMDSTFLGVLAGVGVKLAGAPTDNNQPHVVLINPNSRIAELLENLGVAHLFKVVSETGRPAETFQAAPGAGGVSHEEISRTCLEAHQTLMHLNPANIPRFEEVARFLAERGKKPSSPA